MFKQRNNILVVAVLSIFFLIPTYGCRPSQGKVIRQVDHVLIASNDADELFFLLSDTFQLPVVWPMGNYGRFTSGGVSAGNVYLEIVKMPVSNTDNARSQFIGFALEPEPLEESLKELNIRGITHGASVPFTILDSTGSVTTLWNSVALPDLSNDNIIIFLCEYSHDLTAQRTKTLDELLSRNGGPLSIESVAEIVIGTTNMQESKDKWQRLLEPILPSSQGVWHLEAGPSIHLIETEKNGIYEVVINVRSLDQARDFLGEYDLLGINKPDEITIIGLYLQGLTIKLIERDFE